MTGGVFSILVVLACVSDPAQARRGRPYVMIEAGIADLNNTHVSVDGRKKQGQIDFHTGQMDVGGAAGYDFGPVRAEGEFFYRRTRMHRYYVLVPTKFNDGPPIPTGKYTDATGVTNTYALMANVLAEQSYKKKVAVYGGFGIGVARVGARHFRIAGVRPYMDNHSNRFAWQGIAGVRVPLGFVSETWLGRTNIGIKYRYFQADGVNDRSPWQEKFKFNVRSHSGLLTLGYDF